MGHFKVSSITNLDEVKVGDVINESDYSCISNAGKFVQLAYHSDEEISQKTIVKPGVWAIKANMQVGMFLEKTVFVKDKILEQYIQTNDIVEKVTRFFSKLEVYKEMGIEVPKRGALLYGPPGSGKSAILMKTSEIMTIDNKTAVIIWPTSAFEPYKVKEFIKSFQYDGVERLILQMEDLGGVEISEARLPSDPALLALLDNQEKTFTIPTMIIATTNFPNIFMENLVNRSGRFDDKIEVGMPSAEVRRELLKFFSNDRATEEELVLIASKDCKDFPPAHIKEVYIRHRLYDISITEAIKQIQSEIKTYKDNFEKRHNLGFRHQE